MWYNTYIKHQGIGMAKTAKDILYEIATQKFKDDMVVAAIRYDIIQECIKTERRKSIITSWVVWLIFMFITAGLGALVLLKSDIIEHAGIMYGVLGIITIIISLWAITTTYSACKEHDSDMANLNRIKLVLVEKNKTGKWLADELGKTPCTVSKWCQNTIQPDLNTLDKIATLLKVDRRDLLVPSKIEE